MKAAIVKTLLLQPKIHQRHPKEIIKTTHTPVALDNKGKKGKKKNIVEVACRQAFLKRSDVAAAGKYLWSCHGTRPRLRILFKQSRSEHREGDGDTVPLRLHAGPCHNTTHSANSGATPAQAQRR